MINTWGRNRLLAVALAALCVGHAMPGYTEVLIYKSVDAAGRVSYGDTPLPQAVTVEEIRVTASGSGEAEAASERRIEALAATTARLRDDRLAREAQRAAAVPASEPAGYPGAYHHYPGYTAGRYLGRGLHYPYPYAWPHQTDRFRGRHHRTPERLDRDWHQPHRPPRPSSTSKSPRRSLPLRSPSRQ